MANVSLYTPGRVFGTLLEDVPGLSVFSNRQLRESVSKAYGFVDGLAYANWKYKLGLDIGSTEIHAFVAAWREHDIRILRGNSGKSIENAWESWRENGRIDDRATYTRSNVLNDAKTTYDWQSNVLWYVALDGTRYNAAEVKDAIDPTEPVEHQSVQECSEDCTPGNCAVAHGLEFGTE